jgi:hypothetical protein
MNEFGVLLLVAAGLTAIAVGVWAVFPPAVGIIGGALMLRVAVRAVAEASE